MKILGVDIGGTFTDFALLDSTSGVVTIGKCLTTPDDPCRGFLEGIDDVCRRAGVPYAALDRISHATTLVTNALIERKGCSTGLLVTAGFRDVLLMGRESRYDHYDFRFERPEPLVPRRLTRELNERIAWDGAVIEPLDPQSVRDSVAALAAAGVSAVAVCLLHAYRNPAHEREVKSLFDQEFPELDCVISSDVAPELREYERASTTVCNAYVRKLVRDYLAALDVRLTQRGYRNTVQVMLSNGGITSASVASDVPIQIIESGPAAGALAAAFYARRLDIAHALAFDMGGTTAKLCYIEHGEPRHASWFETSRARRFKRGSGIPLLIPVIELMEIGAGGGSIAQVDHLGLLKVGPHSAGAKPGPAAYRLGGTLPTVTDADVVLGFIDPQRFLGGDMPLDAAAAEQAIVQHVGTPLDLSLADAAWGVFSIVNETMVAAARRYAAERAIDVRDCTLVTFGGAAPLHAWQVARILGVREIVYPMGAGVTSAVGLCIAAPVVHVSRSLIGSLEGLDFNAVSTLLGEMRMRATQMLVSAGACVVDVVVKPTVDIRYKGQGYEIEVPITGIDFGAGDAERTRAVLVERFAEHYARRFGRTLIGGSLEAVTWRMKAEGTQDAHEPRMKLEAAIASDEPLTTHRVYFGPGEGFTDAPVYDRYRLGPGSRGVGPALVQERETTVVVGAGMRWRVDTHMNLRVSL